MKKKIHGSIFCAFWIVYLELIYRIFVIRDFFSLNTLSVILFSTIWMTITALIVGLFNEKVNRIISYFILFFYTLITLAQIVYYNFYDSIFSFYSLTTGTGQVMQFWQMILEVIVRIWYVFVLILIPLILYYIFNKRIFKFNKLRLKDILLNLVLLVFSLTMILVEVTFDNKGVYSLNRLIYKTHAPMLTINKTGLWSMQAIDLYRYIFGFEEEVEVSNTEEVSEKVELEKEKEYNKLDIDFESLIENESNSTIKNMHKYFSSVVPSEKNKYTGLFKGKNLIFITAEAFDTIAIDKDITPTLYKMANNSFVFTNYYQPLYPVSTSDGEYMNLTSLIPKEGVWSFYKSSKISMPMGFGTMFKNEGYTSYGFHNHTYKYYNRQLSHPNIGLSYIGCGNGLEKKMNCKHWPNSDYEMIEATTDYYLNDEKPFATYYMTVSGHLNYNFYGNSMAVRNKNKVKNLKYSDAVKAYYATQIELDKAMELLLEKLEEKGVLDDTLIIIAPDHYPYGLTQKQMNEVSNIDRSDKFENYHTTLIMYNPSIEKTVIDKTISGLDLLPTIYNLYGIEFDSRLLMGRDIFSDSEHIVILSDRSWITDVGRYNSVTRKFTKTTDSEIDEDYIDRINSIVNNRFSMSALILDNNYYKKVGLE
jgi:lipoteichoic acid synthase